jgi:hypothetical protein
MRSEKLPDRDRLSRILGPFDRDPEGEDTGAAPGAAGRRSYAAELHRQQADSFTNRPRGLK